MVNDDSSRLRKAARELYTTDIIPPSRRAVLHEEKVVSKDDWDYKDMLSHKPSFEPDEKPTSFFKNIFLASLVCLGIALIVLGISFLTGKNTISEKNVDMVITSKTFVDGGETLPIDITLVNKNKAGLELATLVIEYPQGNDAAGPGARMTREVGIIEAGATHTESFTVQLYGTENSQRTITAHMQFRVQGSNAVYDKEEKTVVTIRTSPITLSVIVPEKAIPNQEIPLKFTILGNGTTTLPNTAFIAQYPDGFTFTKSEPAPSFGNNVWYLGDIPPGVNRTISIYGTLAGNVTDLKTIRASVGMQSTANEQVLETTYNSLSQVIPLANAFLDARILVGDSTGTTIPVSGTQLIRVRVPWQNTLAIPLTKAQITVVLSGTAYDASLVEPGTGFFDSVNNSIVWTSRENDNLETIPAGGTGELSFNIRPRSLAIGDGTKNPVIKVSVNAQAYQSGGTLLTANHIDEKTLAVNSDLNLVARTMHYGGSLQNTGPMPPVPNKETTYTLELRISNSRNRISGATVTTALPTYVAWKNVIVPDAEVANVTYNSVTRQIIWNVGDIATAASGSATKILSLKVGITPSTKQKGTVPLLTDGLVLTGHDTFTNQDITVNQSPLSTQLLNDGKNAGVSGQVGQ